MRYLALRERHRGDDAPPDGAAAVLPAHRYDPLAGLNVLEDGGAVLVEAVHGPMFGFTITNHPQPIGAKKDDD
ncbi:hypothetical protein [Yinghuangia soli]|uniref:Uncharacterized protein n=1 Tax=Yinghuangia soli TaxID=2908204 RepID=A0AA41Q3G3_9ACTN|nr:hypothetical protein [Yinghuangia soli]MCF2530285.1 hypothetical protein [Yinghuangia soli]